jgi:predicted RNA-binding protein with TRAM domain
VSDRVGDGAGEPTGQVRRGGVRRRMEAVHHPPVEVGEEMRIVVEDVADGQPGAGSTIGFRPPVVAAPEHGVDPMLGTVGHRRDGPGRGGHDGMPNSSANQSNHM